MALTFDPFGEHFAMHFTPNEDQSNAVEDLRQYRTLVTKQMIPRHLIEYTYSNSLLPKPKLLNEGVIALPEGMLR